MFGWIAGIGYLIVLILNGAYIDAVKKALKVILKPFLSLFKWLFRIKEKHKDKKQANYFNEEKSILVWQVVLFIFTVILIIGNLKMISDYGVTHWIHYAFGLDKIISEDLTLAIYTGGLFPIMSFSMSSIMYRWMSTKQARLERKRLKIKQDAKNLLTARELEKIINEKTEESKRNYK